MLRIGGIICNFTPILLDPDFFHVRKLSEDQKWKVFTGNWKVVVPEITWRPKKSPDIIQRSNADHSQIIGRDTVKLLGGYNPPIPPGFSTPTYKNAKTQHFLRSS